jgi:hypothetical protein
VVFPSCAVNLCGDHQDAVFSPYATDLNPKCIVLWNGVHFMTFKNPMQAFIIILVSLEMLYQTKSPDFKQNEQITDELCSVELVSCTGSVKLYEGLK